MAIKIKPVSDIAKKWAEVTPGRRIYYETEASIAGADWEKGATAAEANFRAAVTAANIGKLFAGGVKRAGAAKYERKVKAVGASRFAEGVTVGEPDFKDGFDPFASTIAAMTLPARRPRGDPANIARVTAIATELNKKRLALRAAGV